MSKLRAIRGWIREYRLCRSPLERGIVRLALRLKRAPWMPAPAVLAGLWVVFVCCRLCRGSRGEGKVSVFERVPVEAGQVWWRHDMIGICRCRMVVTERSPQSILSSFCSLTSELDGRYSQHNELRTRLTARDAASYFTAYIIDFLIFPTMALSDQGFDWPGYEYISAETFTSGCQRDYLSLQKVSVLDALRRNLTCNPAETIRVAGFSV